MATHPEVAGEIEGLVRENVSKLYDNGPAKGGVKPVEAPPLPAAPAEAAPAPKKAPSKKTDIDITVDD